MIVWTESRVRRAAVAMLAGAVILGAGAAHAQTLNPRIVSFIPSADHSALDAGGLPLVTSYEFEVFQQGGTAPIKVANIGKPDPAADGNIYVDFMTVLGQPPATGVTLEARVAAVGPLGRGVSTPSNTFTFDSGTTTCSPVVSPTTQTVSAAGGTANFNVSVAAGCVWQATTVVDWITIGTGAVNSGTGTATANIAVNAASTSRSGSIVVAGQTVTINQDAGIFPNASPTVSITGPTSGSSFTAPASITLTATAADSDGSVASVEFYANNKLVATASTSPFTVVWPNVAAGTYTVNAVAMDNLGARTPSSAVTITVNALNKPPTVQLTSPVTGGTFEAPAVISLTATAADSDGSISMVRYYANSAPVGSATAAPFTFTWSNVAVGTYSITAIAIDNAGAETGSAPATITVKAPNMMPSVAVTTPAAGSSFAAGSRIPVSASATDSDGTIAKVEFYADGALLGTATASPFTITWSNVKAGTYSLTAAATDNTGGRAMSTGVTISVVANAPPTVQVTSPTSGASFVAPASITLTASAADANGSVSRVQFFANNALVGDATGTSSFAFTWNNVAAGSYTVIAVASDNAGASTTSAPVSITVVAAAPPTSTTGPDVAIVSPTSGSTVVAPSNLTIQATASDATAPVTRVEFLVNGSLVGFTSIAPYEVPWNARQAGDFTITAVATDSQGNKKNSAPVLVKVAKKSKRVGG